MEYSNTQMQRLILEYIHNERDRHILKRRLIDGRTYDALAEEFDMSERQIKNIVYRGEAVLFKHLPG